MSKRLLQLQVPRVGQAAAGEVQLDGGGARRAIGSATVGYVQDSEGVEAVRVEGNADAAGVPTVEDNGLGMGAEQEAGGLRAVGDGAGAVEPAFEEAVIAGGQGEKDLVGGVAEGFFLCDQDRIGGQGAGGVGAVRRGTGKRQARKSQQDKCHAEAAGRKDIQSQGA